MIMPKTRSSKASAVQRSESAGAVLGKRRSSLRSATSEEENDRLVKKFKIELTLNESRKLRKLKNITNTVDQQATTVLPEEIVVEARKRKLDGDGSKTEQDNGGRKRVRSKEQQQQEIIEEPATKDDVAAAIVDSQEKLKDSLGRHYFDAGNRLNLDYAPNCLRNVAQCVAQHSRRSSQARRVNQRRQRDTKELLIENRPVHFLEYLEQALLRNEFIDPHLFTKALELILSINKPSSQLNADYEITSVLQQAVGILDRTVEQFPPCWLDLKADYQSIIFGDLEEDCFSKYDRSEGLFKVVLFLLERCVESEERGGALLGRTASHERSAASFYLWELENNQKYDFELLAREEKLERLFLVLQILVKILELDLTMWILRHPHKAKENMVKETRKPLVASLLWHEHSTVGEVNSLIKRIINLYVNVVALNYPDENVQVVSRFISVIGTAINLCEIQYDGTVDYPCIKDNTRYFVRQISRLLEASNYYSVSLCLRAIQQMRSPLIRMILVDDLLQKMNHQLDPPSAASYMKHLAKGRWKSYQLDCPAASSSPKPSIRYPFLDHRKQRKSSTEITRSQYVNLLLDGFRSYMEVYPLKHYFTSLKRTPVHSNTPSSSRTSLSSVSSSPKTPTHGQLKAHRYDFAALETKIIDLSKRRKTKKPIVRLIADKPVVGAKMVLEEVNASAALLIYYRDEVKYLLLIQRWLRLKTAGSQENRELFAPWKHYLAQIDETLAFE